MTLRDIAVFKRFIANKDLRRQFIRCYNVSKGFANNPKLIEDYFSNVDALSVITKAIRVCRPNDTYGYAFWQELNEDWKTFYEQTQSSHFYQNLNAAKSIDGYLAVLRENWNDTQKPWVWEPKAIAMTRLGLSPDDDDSQTEEEEDTTFTDASSDSQPPVIEIVDPDPLADFDFFEDNVTSSYKLKYNEASINFNNNSYKITFNISTSGTIKKRSMTNARLGRNKAGDVCLILNNSGQGPRLNLNSHNRNNKENVILNSKDVTTKIRTLLNIKLTYEVLKIEELQSTNDYLIYKLTRQ